MYARYAASPLPHLLCAVVAAVAVARATPVRAEEGMWLPDQVKALEPELKRLGLKVDAAALADMERGTAAAIVQINVGGTGSFVSPDGLFVTNHHVAYDAIQQNSDATHDYLANGFLASSRELELRAPGYKVGIIRAMTDVTADVTAAVPAGADDRARHDAISRRSKELTKACENDGAFRCRVAVMDEGLRYWLVNMFELRDIRLVYAPPEGVGNYGGEVDNFRWPRHVGDYSFLRAYVGPDGKTADYSPQNRPFRSEVYLKLASEPLKDGDLSLTWGFPGATTRYKTATEIAFATDVQLPYENQRLKRVIDRIDEASKTGRDRRIRLAAMREGVENKLTNYSGKLIALQRTHLADTRRDRERKLQAWIDADPTRKQRWGDLLPSLDALHREAQASWRHDQALASVVHSSDLLDMAVTLVRYAAEKPKPDLEREQMFMDRNLPRIREELELAQRDLDPALDRILFTDALIDALELPADQKIAAIDALARNAGKTKESAAKALSARYLGTTRMGQLRYRLELFDGGPQAINASRDPLMQLARTLAPELARVEAAKKTRDGARSRLHPRLIEALQDFSPGPIYPDANFTLRLSYGTVRGYAPADGVRYLPFTTLAGVVAKHTGVYPFNSPKALLEAARGNEALPVSFVSTNDTTGGNSGSPVLNGRGELAGLLYDGNYESTGDDYVFWDEMQRSISCDMRYVVWLMSKVDHADALLDELKWRGSALSGTP